MNYEQSLHYLNSFINYENNLHKVSPKVFGLERVHKLLKALGNPEKDLRIIHVAGTKGKGSTCAVLASVLKRAGYRTGLFTSPHIHDVRERIRVLDPDHDAEAGSDDIYSDMINKEDFAGLIENAKLKIEEIKHDPDIGELTFFEVLTALSLVYFKAKLSDFVILETGLGGRLDATNATDSLVAVITPISFEHTHLLGKSIESITNEKKAIIKNANQKVVLAPQEQAVMVLLKEQSERFGIVPVVVGEDVTYTQAALFADYQIFHVKTAQATYQELRIPLLGEHQLINAGCAIGVIEQLMELGFPVSTEGIYHGLNNTFWPLRFERLSRYKNIILDGAHNVSSSKALAETVLKNFPDKNVTMIMGFTKEKDIQGMCSQFNRIAKRIIATKSSHPRSVTITDKEMKTNFPKKPFVRTDSVEEALRLAKSDLNDDDILLISGSIYVASEARKLCTN